METQENKLSEEPRLCVVRRLEGLIESAAWVKAKRNGLRLVIGMQVTDEHGSRACLTDVFTQHAGDQERLEGLCAALGIDSLFFTLKALVGRKVAVVETIFETAQGEARSVRTYCAREENGIRHHQPTFH